jgi:hypothetical protein
MIGVFWFDLNRVARNTRKYSKENIGKQADAQTGL